MNQENKIDAVDEVVDEATDAPKQKDLYPKMPNDLTQTRPYLDADKLSFQSHTQCLLTDLTAVIGMETINHGQ